MKSITLSALTISASALLIPLAGLQGSIFIDNFDYSSVNEDDTAITASQGAWYVARFNNPSATKAINSGSLDIGSLGTSNASLFGYFQNSGSTHSLAVGETISLEISLSYVGTPASTNTPYTPIRFGIYNSNGSRNTADISGGAANANFNQWTGYSGTWNIGGTTDGAGDQETVDRPGSTYYRQGGIANGLWNWNLDPTLGAHEEDAPVSVSGLYTDIGNPDAGSDGAIVLTLTLERLNATNLAVTSTFADGVSGTYTTSTGTHSGAETAFDTIAILVDNQPSAITSVSIDSISVVPEPAHFAGLAGLMILSWVAVRRRKQ